MFDPEATSALMDRFYDGDDTVWRKLWTLFVVAARISSGLKLREGVARRETPTRTSTCAVSYGCRATLQPPPSVR